jgi:lysophospholipase L1-like esterase
MTTAIVVAAIVLVLAVVGLYARYLARRQGTWRVRLADKIPVHSAYWRERHREAGDIHYVAIGDSTAQGIGASRPNHSYVGFLAAHIRKRIAPRTLRVSNFAVSGGTLRIAIDAQLPKLAKTSPDILTVAIGANDMASFDPLRFEAELRELFAALPRHAIVADLPSFYFLPVEKNVVRANAIVRTVAAEHRLPVVDLHRRTRRQGLWGVSTQFAGDLFHPNDRGYRLWAATFEPEIDKRLKVIAARTP